MTKTAAEIKFDKARKRLARLLKTLEETIKNKLNETSIQSKVIEASENEEDSWKARSIEKSAIIQNLNSELNKLQKNLEKLGLENEFLSEQNRILANKITQLINPKKDN